MTRRALLLALVFVAILLVVVTRRPFPRKPSRPPAVPVVQTPTPIAPVSKPAPETKTETPPSAEEPETPAPTGWLRVTLENPTGLERFKFSAVVFDDRGSTEKRLSDSTLQQFDIGPLKPGRKAVVLFAPEGDLVPVGSLATIPEQGDATLRLEVRAAEVLRGVVVDASGKGVEGVEVGFSVVFPLPGWEVQNPKRYGGVMGGRTTLTAGGARRMDESSGYSLMLSEEGFRLRQHLTTGTEGRFSMKVYGPAAVQLSLRLDTKLLKEESVLPSMSPVRLVIPQQGAEEPKK